MTRKINKFSVNTACTNETVDKLGLCNINGDISILDLSTLASLNSLNMHEMPVQGCCFLSDGQLLLTGSVDYKIGFIYPAAKKVFNALNVALVLAVLLLAVAVKVVFK